MIRDGWLDWAERWPGPADKVYSAPNSCEGIVCHSMEGYGTGGITGRMMSTARQPDGSYTPMAQASWTFSLMRDGRMYQHYPVTASPWASGNRRANTSLWPVEAEGVRGVPLSPEQASAMLRLAEEFEAYTGRRATREPGRRTVWQHNEVWNWSSPNAGPTACPSGRYDQFFELLESRGSDMKPEERELFNALVQIFGGREAILRARDGGMDYLLGYALEQAEQRRLVAAMAALAGRLREVADVIERTIAKP